MSVLHSPEPTNRSKIFGQFAQICYTIE